MAENDELTRAERLRKLYRQDLRKPQKDSAYRQRQLIDLIERESPEDPVRSPLQELLRGPKGEE